MMRGRPPLHRLVAFHCGCGLRRAELSGLKLDDLQISKDIGRVDLVGRAVIFDCADAILGQGS